MWTLLPVSWTLASPASPAGEAMPSASAPERAAQDRTAAWASQLVSAFRAGRIRAAVMWDILLSHIETGAPPDVGSLLEHLPEPHASSLISLDDLLARLEPQDGALLRSEAESAPEAEDWFVMVDGHDAA
jgi:hypothetical protein